MICGICHEEQDLPSYYVVPLNNLGERLDKHSRAELYSGTYDI